MLEHRSLEPVFLAAGWLDTNILWVAVDDWLISSIKESNFDDWVIRLSNTGQQPLARLMVDRRGKLKYLMRHAGDSYAQH